MRTGRTTPLLLAVLLTSTLLTPAAAASSQWELQSSGATFVREGRTYTLHVTALDIDGVERVGVSISRRTNPAGAGRARQVHAYWYPMSGDRFTHRSDLSSARLVTGRQMGVYGSVDLRFTRSGSVRSTCRGLLRKREGRLSGTVTFKTGTQRFDTVRVVPAAATLSHDAGNCSLRTSNRCPPAGRRVGGARPAGDSADQLRIGAFRGRGATTASVEVFYRQRLRNGEGSLHHHIFATVPAGNVRLRDDLTGGVIRGEPGTFLRGSARFRNPHTTWRYAKACGDGKTSVSRYRNGALSGDFTATFFLGRDKSLRRGSIDGQAFVRRTRAS